jgi:hypothetical protein
MSGDNSVVTVLDSSQTDNSTPVVSVEAPSLTDGGAVVEENKGISEKDVIGWNIRTGTAKDSYTRMNRPQPANEVFRTNSLNVKRATAG